MTEYLETRLKQKVEYPHKPTEESGLIDRLRYVKGSIGCMTMVRLAGFSTFLYTGYHVLQQAKGLEDASLGYLVVFGVSVAGGFLDMLGGALFGGSWDRLG